MTNTQVVVDLIIAAGFTATVAAFIWLVVLLAVDYLDHRQARKTVRR